jgi:hypothetical protein
MSKRRNVLGDKPYTRDDIERLIGVHPDDLDENDVRTIDTIIRLVRKGMVEVTLGDKGQMLFHLTGKGLARCASAGSGPLSSVLMTH